MCPSPLNRVKPLVFLVEPHPLAVESLRSTLREKNRVRIVSEDKVFLDEGLPALVDPVFIVDKGTAPSPFAKYLDHLRLRLHRPKIIILDRDCLPEEQFLLLSLGIRGVVRYREVRKKLAAAIAEVARGGLWVAREILTDYVTSSKQEFNSCNSSHALTRRELQVLQLVKRELSNKQIGAALLISESTVKFHLANIFAKLRVRNRQSAVEIAGTDSDHAPLLPVQSDSQAKGVQVSKLLFSAKTA